MSRFKEELILKNSCMDSILIKLVQNAGGDSEKQFVNALLDLRLIIERRTQNRYGDEEVGNYRLLFSDKSLISYRIAFEDLLFAKHFLFYLLFNNSDRAVLAAKCIKVLFDKSSWDAICAGIEYYMQRDDDTTCELIFAITDLDDAEWCSLNNIVELFEKVSKMGREYSKQAAESALELYRNSKE
jgi:hypothetical protein